MTDTLFALGDIHGHRAKLERALDRIAPDPESERIVFVGDYIDRGPDSRGVIRRLMHAEAAGAPWVCLQGNHDTFLPAFLAGPDPDTPDTWIGARWLAPGTGGAETLASYGVDTDPRRAMSDILDDARAAVPAEHVAWLSARPPLHRTDTHVFVHAGIRPGVPLDDQDPEDLIWIRWDFLEDTRNFGRVVVHGHTAIERPEHAGNRINLDGGAGYGRPLDPVRLRGSEATLLTPDGPKPLRPATPGRRGLRPIRS